MTTNTDTAINIAPADYDDRNREIATEILRQQLKIDILVWGCIDSKTKNRMPIANGVRMTNVIVKQGARATRGNIEITLNGLDYYDIVAYSTNQLGQPKKVQFEETNLDPFNLYERIRAIYN